METYTFGELSHNAQDAAIARYNLTVPPQPEHRQDRAGHVAAQRNQYGQAFDGWRFNEHGERIA